MAPIFSPGARARPVAAKANFFFWRASRAGRARRRAGEREVQLLIVSNLSDCHVISAPTRDASSITNT